MEREDWLDLGAYKTLSIEFRLLTPGSAATLTLAVEHAAIAQDDAFTPLSGATLVMTGTAQPSYVHAGNFLRFVRWKVAAATVTEGAVVAVYIIAKD